jgi:hypothetical protein
MLAGALVSRVISHFFPRQSCSFVSQAGISEHTVMYPIDSIKVSSFLKPLFIGFVFMFLR